MTFLVLNETDLDRAEFTNSIVFEGYLHGNTNLSFYCVNLPPGAGPRLHQHPCEEIFIIQEGRATFTVGSTEIEASSGQILIVPPNTPHKFLNSGEGPLRQIDILPSRRIVTEWLEE